MYAVDPGFVRGVSKSKFRQEEDSARVCWPARITKKPATTQGCSRREPLRDKLEARLSSLGGRLISLFCFQSSCKSNVSLLILPTS
eukprot:Skav228231  [mRNA]  locus=scaffold3112:8769:9026:- [translate_table: standard]